MWAMGHTDILFGIGGDAGAGMVVAAVGDTDRLALSLIFVVITAAAGHRDGIEPDHVLLAVAGDDLVAPSDRRWRGSTPHATAGRALRSQLSSLRSIFVMSVSLPQVDKVVFAKVEVDTPFFLDRPICGEAHHRT